MNPEADNEQLLADVMTEGAPADFRKALLDDTLRAVRRRRRQRHTIRAAAIMALFGAVAFWIGRIAPTRSPAPIANVVARAYEVVETRPLSATVLVRTRPMELGDLAPGSALLAIVHTSSNSGTFNRINDDELLALVAARPALLVRRSPTAEQLVFANPDDEKGFPSN